MSNSDIQLDVLATDQSSEVIIVDSSFHVLARGIQRVQLKVPPGIYRAKAKVGDQQSEKLFSVEPNEPNGYKLVELDPLEFSSPIPLQQTSTSRTFHQNAICSATAADGTTVQLGRGAAIVILLRDASLVYSDFNADELAAYGKNFQGFTLSSLDGSEPHSLEAIGKLVPEQGYLIASAAIDPGTYVLSHLTSGTERQCLPLVIPPGWALQVFVSMAPAGDAAIVRQADFDGAAMVLDRPGAGFNPDRPDLRVLEVARQALARGHNVIDSNAMAVLLSGKFENPMMGIFAVHLLLLSKTPDLELAQKVVTNTGNLIGASCPDLLILSWKLGQLRGTSGASDSKVLVESVKGPPMLQLSWHYFMEAYRSLADKDVLDKGISRMARQLVSSSVWMSWLDSANYHSVSADAIGHSASHTPQEEDTFTSSTAIPQVLPELEKSMDSPSFDVGRITRAIHRGANRVKGKVSNWYKARTDAVSLDLPTLETFKVELPNSDETYLETALEKAGAAVHLKLQSVEADAAARIFESLVERVDWKSVLGQLKSVTHHGGEPHPLTPLQRQLLLSLKAAREQFEDEGEVLEDAVRRRLSIPDVPLNAILYDLNLFHLIAKNLDKKHSSSLAKAIVQASHD